MQLDKAEEFKLLQPVYALNFVNDTFEKSLEMQDEYFRNKSPLTWDERWYPTIDRR